MQIRWWLGFLSLAGTAAALILPSGAQRVTTTVTQDTGDIRLDVTVMTRSSVPVSGLQQKDFSILDNKTPQTITFFRALREREAPVEILLVIDDVNASFSRIAFERSEIGKLLSSDGGNLAHPTALAVVTDTGTQIQSEFSTDGNALTAILGQYTIGQHTTPRSGGVYTAEERYQLSVVALHQIVLHEINRPGRKIVLWISPGWPLLGGPSSELNSAQKQQVFTDIVGFATLLREARITLYSIDPLGTQDISGRTFNWEPYLKGVSKPDQAELGDIGLQVLAVQSGGLALTANNDLLGMLRRCLADLQAYYELSFSRELDQKKNEYHHIEVRVAQPAVTARTRLGYYSQVTNVSNH
jgi:VWFA-related protein